MTDPPLAWRGVQPPSIPELLAYAKRAGVRVPAGPVTQRQLIQLLVDALPEAPDG